MKKMIVRKVATAACMGGLALCSNAVVAGQVGTMNTFNAGTPAVAADVNANFVEQTAQINDNDTRIVANEAAVTTNAADIVTNATDIATNATDIATNASGIAANSSDIATNASDIAALDARIAALEGGSTLTVADIQGDYSVVLIESMLHASVATAGVDSFGVPREGFTTELASIIFDGAGNFSGTVGNGEEVIRDNQPKSVDPDGVADSGDEFNALDSGFSITATTGNTFSGTYSVSGNVITLTYSDGVTTEDIYPTASGDMFMARRASTDTDGSTYESHFTTIMVGVKTAPYVP